MTFHCFAAGEPVGSYDSEHAPATGQVISIEDRAWRVLDVTHYSPSRHELLLEPVLPGGTREAAAVADASDMASASEVAPERRPRARKKDADE